VISVWIGIAAGVIVFFPRILVESSGPYDASNPSPITFTISNVNIVPLREVQPMIGMCFLAIPAEEMSKRDCNGSPRIRMVQKSWRVRWLDADEKWQIALEEAISIGHTKQQIENADITIGVEYTPWWLPEFWRDTKEFRFVTKKRSDGKIYWVPTPLNVR
jgi:hypothetical protein